MADPTSRPAIAATALGGVPGAQASAGAGGSVEPRAHGTLAEPPARVPAPARDADAPARRRGADDDDRPARSVAEIEAEIADARARLVVSLDELKAQAAPKAVAARGAEKARGQVQRVRAVFVDEYGGVRVDRVAAVAGGVVVVLLVRRRRRRRRAA